MQHRSAPSQEQPDRRAHGGRDRSAVPPAVQAHGRGHGGVRDGRVQFAAVGHGEDQAPRATTTAKSIRSRCRSPAPIPQMMADAARYNVDDGAQIIDINMGCPAKKVCNVAGGLRAAARTSRWSRASSMRSSAPSTCPVTLKIRTGWDPQQPQRGQRSRGSPKSAASGACRCTGARAPACSSARPSTTRSPK